MGECAGETSALLTYNGKAKKKEKNETYEKENFIDRSGENSQQTCANGNV